ncbi:MAG: AraC family transcriptional regulator [Verrucomicrobia bacterium]|nr:AraC family transcriptional regulator [Verrucomicrobiota bacterium]
MRKAPKETKIIVSLFHTPTEGSREIFYCVLRAGHLIAGQDYKRVHPNYPGHKLLLCLKGEGFIEVNGRAFPVKPGDLGWIYNHHANKHWPADNSPWEILWIRVDGPHMDQIYKTLTAAGSPVFSGVDARLGEAIFRRIFRIMQSRGVAMEAALHAEVANVVKLLFTSRHEANPQPGAKVPEIPMSLVKPMEAMRLYYEQPLRVADLAAMAGMSVSNFFRHFKAATGTSPIDWLKRERINQAKRRLLETNDSLAKIAEETGYYDQFYFSRDFKRVTGIAPSHYRARERAHKTAIGTEEIRNPKTEMRNKGEGRALE